MKDKKITLGDLLNAMNNEVTYTFSMIEAKTIKQWWKISMWVSSEAVTDIAKGKKFPILIVIDSEKFENAKKELLK